ncbi:MAG: putative membrane protein [Paracoccaceae bacterium]|jgi:uncharacterized membrane protein
MAKALDSVKPRLLYIVKLTDFSHQGAGMTVAPRIALFALSLIVALVSWRFLALGVAQSMPHMLYQALGRPLAFYAHVGLAPVALALTPFQLWTGLRVRRPAVHRWLGRVSAGAILVSGLGGMVLAAFTTAGTMAALGFGVLSILWPTAMALGVVAAMQGRIADHRRWMIRTAALTLGAVTLRLQLPLATVAMGLPFEDAYPVIAWSSWVPNALVAEWLLRRHNAKRP